MKYSNKFLSLFLAVLSILIFSVLWFVYDYQKQNESYYVERVTTNISDAISDIESLYAELPASNDSIRFSFDKLNDRVDRPLIILNENNEPVYWSTSKYLPYENIDLTPGINLVANNNGEYLTYIFLRNEFKLVFYIPLFEKSEINNAYIGPRANPQIFENNDIRISTDSDQEGYYAIQLNDNEVFSVAFQPSYRIHFGVADFFMFVSIISFAIFITIYITLLVKGYNRG
ncbi:hypothetical protein [Mangrovivirga cuniculi]|uniref:Two-component sensor histidine kinase n=1 Tax=Mangrovivirga cuniculi TaxID=2715131 RepID=A0A4D7JEH7_9BACT|nr:hypothetical protein [Mangrovivirga cuniculi]QCK14639.1 hypothetical protein DCC35_07730 [Mangrovivirga cuniculi]